MEPKPNHISRGRQFINDYGMIFVLLFLMLILSAVTIDQQRQIGAAAGQEVAAEINRTDSARNVLIATPQGKLDIEFAQSIQASLDPRHELVATIQGGPREVSLALQQARKDEKTINLIACTAA